MPQKTENKTKLVLTKSRQHLQEKSLPRGEIFLDCIKLIEFLVSWISPLSFPGPKQVDTVWVVNYTIGIRTLN